MSLFVLDTDILTLYQMGHAEVVRNVLARPISELAVSVISVEEQLGGWYTRLRRSKKPDEIARVYQMLANTVQSLARFRIPSFTEPAIQRHADLKRQKLNIGKKDLCIAAIVLQENAILVTRNRQDFERVPGLTIEDWSQ